MEAKELINLPMHIKRAMDQTGYACKGALYDIQEDQFQLIFEVIGKKIYSFRNPTDFLRMSHKNQIIVMSKYITIELNQTILKGDVDRTLNERSELDK